MYAWIGAKNMGLPQHNRGALASFSRPGGTVEKKTSLYISTPVFIFSGRIFRLVFGSESATTDRRTKESEIDEATGSDRPRLL